MILGTDDEKEIGSRHTGVWINHVLYEQPFVVLREATLDEWLEQEELLVHQLTQSAETLKAAKFYEGAMDVPEIRAVT